MTGRRELSLEGLGDVMPEVDRLLNGYRRLGRWSLGQVAHHLSVAIRLTSVVRDRPEASAPGPDPGTVAAKAKFFESRRFRENAPIPAEILVPPSDVEDRAEVEALRRAIEQFEAATGPTPTHPFFGPLTRQEWASFHAIHAAHHLSFLQPDEAR